MGDGSKVALVKQEEDDTWRKATSQSTGSLCLHFKPLLFFSDYKNISGGKLQIFQKYVMEKAKAIHNSIGKRESL